MKKKAFVLLVIAILGFTTTVIAQKEPEPITVSRYKSIDEFGFEKYSDVSKFKINSKGILDINNNWFVKHYTKRVNEYYKKATINFAGKYIFMFFETESGGVLIDYSNGKAYNIPINDTTEYMRCRDENKSNIFEQYFGDKIIFFNKNSNLLVLRSCSSAYDGIIFRFYVWNENMKEFTLLKIEKNIF